MTFRADVEGDANYIPVLDHGFVGLVDAMGSDSSIVRAARCSYGSGTKAVNEDRGLIRYLLRHKHMTPFEMVEFTFHLKMPIFIARQHIRHRTASVNEYSARYSVMSDEFYQPAPDRLQAQSKTNKQGSQGLLGGVEAEIASNTIRRVATEAYKDYLSLLNEDGGRDYGDISDRKGLARELARSILPVANYTEMYWKIDLRNLMNYISLRADSHAQHEIQVYANAMAEFVKIRCPMAWEAFEDYMMGGSELSRMECSLIKLIFDESNAEGVGVKDAFSRLEAMHDGRLADAMGMSKREMSDFRRRWDL